MSRVDRAGIGSLLSALLLLSAGCGRAQQAADSQLKRMRQTESQAAETLTKQGWEMTQNGQRWTAKSNGVEITDEMLLTLGDYTQLVGLDLEGSPLTSDHVKQISQLQKLMSLNLADTGITDADLATLNEMFLLTQLNVRGTKVTKSGAEVWLKERKADQRILPMFRSPKIVGFE